MKMMIKVLEILLVLSVIAYMVFLAIGELLLAMQVFVIVMTIGIIRHLILTFYK